MLHLRRQGMKLALELHFPSILLHLFPQLVNQFRNLLRSLLFLGILDALGIGHMTSVQQLQLLGMKAGTGHAVMKRVVVGHDGQAVGPLRLQKVGAQLHGSVEQ